MKLTKTAHWIITHETENGTLRLPNVRHTSKCAARELERKGLAVYGINTRKQGDMQWAGWWITPAGLKYRKDVHAVVFIEDEDCPVKP